MTFLTSFIVASYKVNLLRNLLRSYRSGKAQHGSLPHRTLAKCYLSRQLLPAKEFSTKPESSTESASCVAEDSQAEIVNVTFISPEGEKSEIKGKVGDNVLRLGVEHEVGCEGACDCSLACTTCHMYIDQKYEQFTGEMSDEEEDLLDCAVFLRPNSRLTCQIHLTKEMDGIVFTLPKATVNFYVDGHKPTPH